MEDGPHILVVDDDREIRDLLARFLRRHGFRVQAVADGRAMAQALRDWKIDLVVLDLMLPGDDGLTLCRELRRQSEVPVIMLTAMGEEIDRIVGLEVGADDYLAKPFNPRELLARIKAVLRRTGRAAPPAEARETLHFAGFVLDPAGRTLTAEDGRPIDLTGGELDLLIALVQRPQRVLSREQLLDLARGRDAQPFDRSVDVQISRIRRKVEPDPARPALIRTVRGGGYMLACKVERG